MIAAVIGVVVYRITVVAAMNENNSLRQFSSIATSITAAVIQVILITVLDKVHHAGYVLGHNFFSLFGIITVRCTSMLLFFSLNGV